MLCAWLCPADSTICPTISCSRRSARGDAMTDDPASLFPAKLADAAAVTLCDFLHELALAADVCYLA